MHEKFVLDDHFCLVLFYSDSFTSRHSNGDSHTQGFVLNCDRLSYNTALDAWWCDGNFVNILSIHDRLNSRITNAELLRPICKVHNVTSRHNTGEKKSHNIFPGNSHNNHYFQLIYLCKKTDIGTVIVLLRELVLSCLHAWLQKYCITAEWVRAYIQYVNNILIYR